MVSGRKSIVVEGSCVELTLVASVETEAAIFDVGEMTIE